MFIDFEAIASPSMRASWSLLTLRNCTAPAEGFGLPPPPDPAAAAGALLCALVARPASNDFRRAVHLEDTDEFLEIDLAVAVVVVAFIIRSS